MNALVLAVLLAQAADAPLVELPPRGQTVELEAGQPVPFKAVCLDEAQAVREAKRCSGDAAGLKVAESKTMFSTPVLVGGIVGVVAVVAAAFAAGYAAGKVVK